MSKDEKYEEIDFGDWVKELNWQQLKAIKYLAYTNLSPEVIAVKIGVTATTIRVWMRSNNNFKKCLSEQIAKCDDIDREYRNKEIKKIIPNLYSELQKRIADGDLSSVSLKTITKMLTDLQHEIRLDTEGDVTSKSQKTTLSDLSARYKKSKNLEKTQSFDGEEIPSHVN